MYYAKIKPLDVANGTGIRVSLFVSGCRNHCIGCFNPETWNFTYGEKFTEETIEYILKLMEEPYIKGLSILGGDPMEPENIPYVLFLMVAAKNKFPYKDIWIYTGYIYEHIIHRDGGKLLKYADVLVDGPFVKSRANPKLAFRGSENQRIIKLKDGLMESVIL